MNHTSRLFLQRLACLLALCPAASFASPAPAQMIVQWDNDLLTGSDRDYTNGARVAFIRDLDPDQATHNTLQKSLYRLSGAESGSPLSQFRFFNHAPRRFAWGVGLTQLMFTPDDFTTPRAPEGERPYAGWVGLECSLHVKNDYSASSVTLSLGTTGDLSYADDAQNWVHTNISGSPLYTGWKSQIPGEFTANLHFDHKLRMVFFDSTKDWPIQLDGYYEWGAALGNFRTDAYLGTLLRAGYNLPATYATPRVQIGSYGHVLFREKATEIPPISIFGFAGVRATAVLHDISLDGPLFRDFDTGVDRKPAVGELLIGFGLRWANCDLSVSRTLRSDEFHGQDENQAFGSVMLRVHLPF